MSTKRDPAWQAAFLQTLRATGIVKVAAGVVGIDRKTPYKRRDTNEAFRKLWDEAMEDAADSLEQEALRRAVTGWEEPVFGTVSDAEGRRIKAEIGRIRKYSDNLLLALLAARRPDRFGRHRLEHSGPGGGPIPYKGDAEATVDGEILRLSRILGERAAAAARGADAPAGSPPEPPAPSSD